MKNLVLDNSIKNIKYNKKKYVPMCMGIILATFLMTLVLTIGYNMKKISIENQIQRSGDFDFSFLNVSDKEYELLRKDEMINQDSICRTYFNTGNKFNELPNLTVDIVSADENFFSLMNGGIALKEGRYPTNSKEIIIEDWVSNRDDREIKVGDSLSTTLNGEKKFYKIVGFYNNFNTSQYRNKVNFYTVLDSSNEKDNILSIFFKLKDEKKVSKNFETYRNLVGKEHFKANDPVLFLKGNHEEGANIESLRITEMLLVPAGLISITMIFNILNISLIQRLSHFGTLKTLGANRKMIKKFVLVESALLVMITIPIGLLISVLVIKALGLGLKVLGIFSFNVSVSLLSLLLAAAFALIAVIIASLFALIGINKLSPLDAIVGSDKGKYKKSRFRPFSNLELNISNKSMKRRKKNYVLTLMSITFSSLIIFIYFSSNSMMNSALEIFKTDIGGNCSVYSSDTTTGDYEKTYNVLKSIKGVDVVYKDYNIIPDKVNVISSTNASKEFNSIIHVYDLERLKNSGLKNYTMENNIDTEGLVNGNKVLVRSRNLKDLKIGQKLKLLNFSDEVEIGGFLFNDPVDESNPFSPDEDDINYKADIKVILSDKLYRKLSKDELKLFGYDLVLNKAIDETATKKEIQKNMNKYLCDMKFVDKSDSLKMRQKSLDGVFYILAIIIVLIVGTSLLMLYNTSKSNVIMRKRELAMLKAMGMNNRQVTKTVIYEALIYALKGGVVSIILGFIATNFAYKLMCTQLYFNWSLPIYIPILTFVIMAFSTIIAVLPSVNEIKKQNIISNINMQ